MYKMFHEGRNFTFFLSCFERDTAMKINSDCVRESRLPLSRDVFFFFLCSSCSCFISVKLGSCWKSRKKKKKLLESGFHHNNVTQAKCGVNTSVELIHFARPYWNECVDKRAGACKKNKYFLCIPSEVLPHLVTLVQTSGWRQIWWCCFCSCGVSCN